MLPVKYHCQLEPTDINLTCVCTDMLLWNKFNNNRNYNVAGIKLCLAARQHRKDILCYALKTEDHTVKCFNQEALYSFGIQAETFQLIGLGEHSELDSDIAGVPR